MCGLSSISLAYITRITLPPHKNETEWGNLDKLKWHDRRRSGDLTYREQTNYGEKKLLNPTPSVSENILYHQRIHIFSLISHLLTRYRPCPPLSRSDITYLLTRSDSLPGPRLRGMRGKLRRGRGWGAMRTVSSLPWWAAAGCPGCCAVTFRGLSSSYTYLLCLLGLSENQWARFQIWLIDLGFMSRRAVDIKFCQYKSFPRTIKQWTSKQRMTVSY